MLENYFPLLLFIIVGTLVGVASLASTRIFATLLGLQRPDAEKLSPYECGFEAFEDARMKFDVRYYLVAILFILFDLEVAFLFPWASIFREIVGNESIKMFGFVEMLVFLAVLTMGWWYVVKKGALDWSPSGRSNSEDRRS